MYIVSTVREFLRAPDLELPRAAVHYHSYSLLLLRIRAIPRAHEAAKAARESGSVGVSNEGRRRSRLRGQVHDCDPQRCKRPAELDVHEALDALQCVPPVGYRYEVAIGLQVGGSYRILMIKQLSVGGDLRQQIIGS